MSEKGSLPAGYKHGRFRVFYTSTPADQLVQKSTLTSYDHFFIFALLSLGVLVRLYRLPLPDQVVFDEVHFGGFVHEYFHGKFFVDVHPPLAKLIYYWIALLAGYDGGFWVSYIGQTYEKFPFVALRMFSGICGVLSVVFTYLALRANFCRPITAAFGAFLVLIEGSLITVSRYILLDSPLICAMAFTVWMFNKFRIASQFSASWYKYLFLTGVGLGLTLSIKASGIFTFVWIGVLTAKHLWTVVGDIEVRDLQVFRHIALRLLYLVVLPFLIYSGVFALHFQALPNLGPGAGVMSPNFKATLVDADKFRNMPVEVGYGSTITIKHNALESYLHSHKFKYRGGNKEQQVTLYGFHTDFNNEWEIHYKGKTKNEKLYNDFKPVKDGDVIRLFHKNTKQYLHVDNVRPPVTERDYANQVSCNGTREQLGDINYEYQIKIIDKKPHAPNDLARIKLRATESVFQIYHQGTRCTLLSHNVRLPKWGFDQNEVMCFNEPTIPNTLWYIEYNAHPALKKSVITEKVHLGKYPFYKKLFEYHKAMWTLNQGLTKKHAYESDPETWPLSLRGINFYSNNAGGQKLVAEGSHVFLIGNIAIYSLAVLSIALIGFKQAIYLINHLNPFSLVDEPLETTMFYATTIDALVGYFLHYSPYFYMQRQRFLHHYLGALYIAIPLVAYFLEYQMSKRKFMAVLFMASVFWVTVWTFFQFMPLIYGTPWTVRACNNLKLFSGWDFDCMAYSN